MSMEAFTPGKMFKANNGILFFDELNRCPEKLQNALLQVLEEGNVTLGNYDVPLPARFIFIGTMNPEDTSTEKLSDVFIDRFDLIHMNYPETLALEKEIVRMKGKSILEFPDSLLEFALDFVRLLRESKKLGKKPSVRASIGIFERAQANAFLAGRAKVGINDVKDILVSVLAHRLELKPSSKYVQSPEEFLNEELKEFTERWGKEHKGDYR